MTHESADFGDFDPTGLSVADPDQEFRSFETEHRFPFMPDLERLHVVRTFLSGLQTLTDALMPLPRAILDAVFEFESTIIDILGGPVVSAWLDGADYPTDPDPGGDYGQHADRMIAMRDGAPHEDEWRLIGEDDFDLGPEPDGPGHT